MLAQLDATRGIVAELEAMGCRVLGVVMGNWRECPRVHIAEPTALLERLDAQRIDTSGARYIEGGVTVDGVDIIWLIERPRAAAVAEASAP